ncbi:hypothetical protein Tco_0547736 [Tanacetum coccineum]
MTEMFRILKELTTSRAPEKVLIREEAKFLVTKNVNSISLTRGEEERSEKTDVTTGDDFEKLTEMPVKGVVKEIKAENEPNRPAEKEKTTKAPSSQPVEYNLKHEISENLIEGLVGRKAHLLEDKQILSVRVFDEVFSTGMAFGGNTRNLGSFGKETDKTNNFTPRTMNITLLIQNLETTSTTNKATAFMTTHVIASRFKTTSGRG